MREKEKFEEEEKSNMGESRAMTHRPNQSGDKHRSILLSQILQ